MTDTTWIDAADPEKVAEAAESNAPIAGPTERTVVLAIGSDMLAAAASTPDTSDSDCADSENDAMLEGEVSSPRQRTPIPTAVRRAIEEGYPLAGAPVARVVDPESEDSVPHDIKGHDEIVYRLRKLDAGHIELGRAVGQISSDIRSGFAQLEADISGHLGRLITYADLAEKRAVAKEQAEMQARAAIIAAEAQARVEIAKSEAKARETIAASQEKAASARAAETGHNVELQRIKLSYREKIGLALIGVLSTALLGYLAMNHVSLK